MNLKLIFVSFGFRVFLVVFERISFYFHFVHSDVRINQNILFRYQNKFKIRSQKRIGFMHVEITSYVINAHLKINPTRPTLSYKKR
jgi:hypothetical protein